MRDSVLILFTRIPIAGMTKTRLMPLLSSEDCRLLHRAFLHDIHLTLQRVDSKFDLVVYYTPDGDISQLEELLPSANAFLPQNGKTLGSKMHNAITDMVGFGYKKCLLMGSDIPLLTPKAINEAFYLLDDRDIVLCPTTDGGYYLIGMKEVCPEVFSLDEYGLSDVLDKTIKAAVRAGKSYALGEPTRDIDEPEDLCILAKILTMEGFADCPETKNVLSKAAGTRGWFSEKTAQQNQPLILFEQNGGYDLNAIDLSGLSSSHSFCKALGIVPGEHIAFTLLGHGEYNLNYQFVNPATNKKLVLRIPVGSQMHLENQVRYEYDALKLLESSCRTPKPIYIDASKSAIDYGFLVMEFLPGRPLIYETDLFLAADCLADIHNLDATFANHLITPKNPLRAILDECHAMFHHYFNCESACSSAKSEITSMLGLGGQIAESFADSGVRSVINTELNSGNFLVNIDRVYLIDWEKPLYGSPAQDLGHFLAPTTTFWKTDTFLTKEEMLQFAYLYCSKSARYFSSSQLWEEVCPYLRLNCLRGVTWCAMAWVEYQSPSRLLKDDYTFEKIKQYLSPAFLSRIRKEYLCE